MSKQEINNELLISNDSYACAPSYDNESLLFNMVLNTNYENTKENCLIFLRHYSRLLITTKRDLYKILINGLISINSSSKSTKEKENLNSFTRLILNKYTMNNIINALYDFISEKDEIVNINNIIEEKKEEDKIDLNDEESIMNQSLNSINSSVNKKKKNLTFISKKRKRDINEDIQYNNKNEKEESDENDKDNNIKIIKEKDDIFKRSSLFEENDNYNIKLRNRNKSLGLKNVSKYNLRNIVSLSGKKRQLSFSNEKDSINRKKEKENKPIKLEEGNLRSHIIKKKGMILSYKMMKCQNRHSKKIYYLCNNEKCRGKGVYLIEENIFKETEKHNFKFPHNTAYKLKNIKEMLMNDKNCDGLQMLKNDEFIKDKKVVFLK